MQCYGWRVKFRRGQPEGHEDVEGVSIVEEDVDEAAIIIQEDSVTKSWGMGLTWGVAYVEGWTEIG